MMQNADKQAIFRMYPLPSDIISLLPSPRLARTFLPFFLKKYIYMYVRDTIVYRVSSPSVLLLNKLSRIVRKHA